MAGGTVMTVLGPVAPEDLGPTLTHEHLLVDLTCYWQPPEPELDAFAHEPVGIENLGLIRRNPLVNLDNCVLGDLDLAIEEARAFGSLGGRTLVDVTLPDIGRDPVALQRAARETGLNVVAGCGHYVHLAHPPALEEEPVESIAERLVSELEDGIGDTGVRPGVIGEIGTSDPLHPREEKVLRAAALAQAKTGVPITLHLHPASRTGLEMLAILEAAGADPGKIVMGHADFTLGHLDIGDAEAVAYHRSLAERGCYVEFDGCGKDAYMKATEYSAAFWVPSDRQRAEALARLFDLGFGDRLLLSQDVCFKYELTRYGGFGYAHVLRSFRRNLADAGLGERELEQLLVENPRRMLSV